MPESTLNLPSYMALFIEPLQNCWVKSSGDLSTLTLNRTIQATLKLPSFGSAYRATVGLKG